MLHGKNLIAEISTGSVRISREISMKINTLPLLKRCSARGRVTYSVPDRLTCFVFDETAPVCTKVKENEMREH